MNYSLSSLGLVPWPILTRFDTRIILVHHLQAEGLCTSNPKLAEGWWRSQELAEKHCARISCPVGLLG